MVKPSNQLNHESKQGPEYNRINHNIFELQRPNPVKTITILYYNCKVWLMKSLNQPFKDAILVASANPLRIVFHYPKHISSLNIHVKTERATLQLFAIIDQYFDCTSPVMTKFQVMNDST
jgi:hypothetical protein